MKRDTLIIIVSFLPIVIPWVIKLVLYLLEYRTITFKEVYVRQIYDGEMWIDIIKRTKDDFHTAEKFHSYIKIYKTNLNRREDEGKSLHKLKIKKDKIDKEYYIISYIRPGLL